ncbi:MAG: tetratricopeptide repeat protein [Phycisphaerales bacterium]
MTNRVVAVAILMCGVLVVGCASNDVDNFRNDLSPIVNDNTAQKREAIVLVDRAYVVYYNEGRKEEVRVREAADLLQQAIQLDPGFATAHLNLGVLHLEQDNLPTAVARLRTAQRLMPSDARPGYHLGVAYYRMGHAQPAIETFVESIRVDPSNVMSVRGLVLACRSIYYADDTTLEILERSQLMEPDEEWRQLYDREITRQRRQLELR